MFPLLILVLSGAMAQTSEVPTLPTRDAVPKLKLNKKDNPKYTFAKLPYVDERNFVHIVPGEKFGVNVSVASDESGEINALTYQPDLKKADITFEFREEKGMMMLTIKSNLKRRIYMDGGMAVPDRDYFLKTSLVPLEPGLTNFESWPHPITHLIVARIRFSPGTTAAR
jgi:hypothetical protein